MLILIAEDERVTRATLERQLRAWGHEVVAAADGQEAWERFEATPDVDVVITDWEMPHVSGVELVRRVRGSPRVGYVYVILLTGRSEKGDVVKGIEAGADDYVSKPFDRDELRVRVLAGERVVRLERALARQNAELRHANEQVRQGMLAAARVQRSMLPKANVVTPCVRTAWKYVPTEEVAGDAIGLTLIEDRYLVAYVLDVSGHGAPAALLSMSAMHTLAPEPAARSLLRRFGEPDNPFGTVQMPARIAADLNRRFCSNQHDGRYLTMALCVLDTFDGRAQLVSAGHPWPILLRAGQTQPVPTDGGLPIGVYDDAEYDDGGVQLQPGDRLCLYSDGVNEQPAAGDGEPFGVPRLERGLADRTGLPADDAVAAVVEDLVQWAGPGSFVDDVSLLVIEWTGRAG